MRQAPPTIDPLSYMPAPQPELLLLTAILERAIRDATGSGTTNSIIISRGRQWIFDWMPWHEPEAMTFGWVCEALGQDPKDIQALVQGAIDRGETYQGATPGAMRRFLAA